MKPKKRKNPGLQEEELARLRENPQTLPNQVENLLEPVNMALLSYEMGTQDEKRDLLRIVTSNRSVERKSVESSFRICFARFGSAEFLYGGPYRDTLRTLDAFWLELLSFFQREKDLSARSGL